MGIKVPMEIIILKNKGNIRIRILLRADIFHLNISKFRNCEEDTIETNKSKCK